MEYDDYVKSGEADLEKDKNRRRIAVLELKSKEATRMSENKDFPEESRERIRTKVRGYKSEIKKLRADQMKESG